MEAITDTRKEPLKIHLNPTAQKKLEDIAEEQLRTPEQQATAFILQALELMPAAAVPVEPSKVAGNGKRSR